jgi:hypothetical protein
MGPNSTEVSAVLTALQSRYDIKQDELDNYLGLEFQQDEQQQTVQLCQRQYNREMAETFRVTDTRPISTPMDPGFQAPPAKETTNTSPTHPFNNS